MRNFKTVLARVVAMGAAFLMSIVVARSMTAGDAGIYFLSYTIITLTATVGRFGTDNLALRILGGDSSNKRADLSNLFRTALLVSVVAGLITPLIFRLFVGASLTVSVIIFASSAVVAQAASVLAGSALRGLGSLASGVTAELGSTPMIAVLMIVGYSFAAGPVPLGVGVSILAAASWVTAVWSVPLALVVASRTLPAKELGPEPRAEASLGTFLRLRWRHLGAMAGTSTIAFGTVWAPNLILGWVSTAESVAYYSVGVRLANLVGTIPTIQIAYLAPRFAELFYANKVEELNRLANRSVKQAAMVTLVPLLVLTAIPGFAISVVFGAGYDPAVPVVLILSWATLAAMALGQVNQLMLLCGLERSAFILNIGMLVLWVTIGFGAASIFGYAGVTVVAGILQIAYAAGGAFWLRRRTGIESYLRAPGRRNTAGV